MLASIKKAAAGAASQFMVNTGAALGTIALILCSRGSEWLLLHSSLCAVLWWCTHGSWTRNSLSLN